MTRPPPSSTLFPYTTLFRSQQRVRRRRAEPRREVDLDHCVKVYLDRKSTRLNSSHSQISYAVFCLKKKSISTTRLRSVSSGRYPANSQPCQGGLIQYGVQCS